MKPKFALCTGSLMLFALFSAQSFAGQVYYQYFSTQATIDKQQCQVTYTYAYADPAMTQYLGASSTVGTCSQNSANILDPKDGRIVDPNDRDSIKQRKK